MLRRSGERAPEMGVMPAAERLREIRALYKQQMGRWERGRDAVVRRGLEGALAAMLGDIERGREET
jgi:hypothetical protein